MSSSQGSTADQPNHESRSRCCGNGGRRGNWSCPNIVAMVLGFVLFWPVGLLILYGCIKGVSVTEVPKMVRHKWSKMKGSWHQDGNHSSDNVTFNEFQQTQYDRIREIRDEIKERSRRFTQFRENAKRRADGEEFNHFMDDAPVQNDG